MPDATTFTRFLSGRFRRSSAGVAAGDIEIAGIDVLGERPQGIYPMELPVPPRHSGELFDIGAILRLRTFLYLIAATALFLFQIHNTLSIRDLAQENERLREQLRISTSVRTSQELKAAELQSIHNISGRAQALGLISSAVPPVDIEP
jgi:hypothetical protein